jgi:peptidyl-prolyl cis-trans isomerase D
MLTWISEQAKWVIYIFIVFIIAGLLFMDQASLQTNEIPPIAKVNGEKISAEEYATQLTARQRQSAGQQVSDADQARLRKEVFENMIQARLLNSQISELGIQASGFEMHKDMLLSPPPGIRQNPQFMGADSQFDPKKYEIWLATDSVYNSASMRQYENYLEKEKIPLLQLQSYISASFHVSNLETEFSVARRENKAKFVVLSTPIDSFEVTEPTEAEVKAVFESKTDSFFIKEDLAKMDFISLAILPSVADEKKCRKIRSVFD